MKILHMFFVAVVILIAGCEQQPENAEQSAFLRKIRVLESELRDLQNTALFGQDSSQKIAPENIDELVAKKKEEILTVLHKDTPNALLWNAEILALKREGAVLVVSADYEEQIYHLRVVDEGAKKIAEGFVPGDQIKFSGDIGPERSKTLFGALSAAEFSLYPTVIQHNSGELVQAQELIKDSMANDLRISVAQAKEEQEKADESEFKTRTKEICQEVILNDLKYPESAYFPTFIKQYKKVSKNQVEYFDVVSAKNDFGGDIPRRFRCLGTISGNQIRVSVKFLD